MVKDPIQPDLFGDLIPLNPDGMPEKPSGYPQPPNSTETPITAFLSPWYDGRLIHLPINGCSGWYRLEYAHAASGGDLNVTVTDIAQNAFTTTLPLDDQHQIRIEKQQ
ncbi:hypothetical protein CHU67_00415 [Corynebacterium sp. LK19]|nr:hypothetical protein CHU67_00415 [Corynebacterium sp. LK19]